MSFYNKVKVVTLGDAGVGKSSIVLRMREKEPKAETYIEPGTTIGIDYSLVQLSVSDDTETSRNLESGTLMFRVEIWDTAGQERYQAIVNSYLRYGDVFLIVFDCTNQYSFANVQNWLDRAFAVQP